MKGMYKNNMNNLIILDYKFYLIAKICILEQLIFSYTSSFEATKLRDFLYLVMHKVSIVDARSSIDKASCECKEIINVLNKRLIKMKCIQTYLYG